MNNTTLHETNTTSSHPGVQTEYGHYQQWLDTMGELRSSADGSPTEAAKTNLLRGRLLRQQGDSESALIALQAALISVLHAERAEERALRSIVSEELLQMIRGAS